MQAEAEYKQAQTPEERLVCLKKMYALMPKHKGTDKLQAELKSKISEAKEEAERAKKSGKKSGISYKVPKQGAGQYVMLGAPNSGKSRLLTRLTRAHSEVAVYPFTTREPIAGMMEWQDVRVQLVDLPPITADFLEPYVTSLTRAADGALLFLDLADDDGPFATQTVIDRLAEHKTILADKRLESEVAAGEEHIKTLLIANKTDDPGAMDRLSVAQEMFAARFSIQQVDGESGTGIETLREVIFKFLNVIRVFSKHPGKPADKTAPFTCPANSTVADFAVLVHRDFGDKMKSARIWGSGVFDGQAVGKEHVLHDGDMVELHV